MRIGAPKGFPEKLKILGLDYKVQYFDNAEEAATTNSQTSRGSVDTHTCIIKLCVFTGGERVPKKTIWNCLIHEIMHVLVDEMSVLSRDETVYEESLVTRLATGFNQVLWDNKLRFDR